MAEVINALGLKVYQLNFLKHFEYINKAKSLMFHNIKDVMKHRNCIYFAHQKCSKMYICILLNFILH